MTPPSCRVKDKFSNIKPESGRESASCAILWESLLPVFQFEDARLRGGRGGKVQSEVSSRWVGVSQVGVTHRGVFNARRDGRCRWTSSKSLDKVRSESSDVDTTSLCSLRCAGFAMSPTWGSGGWVSSEEPKVEPEEKI